MAPHASHTTTALAIPASLLLAFCGARNLTRGSLPGRLLYGAARSAMNLLRSNSRHRAARLACRHAVMAARPGTRGPGRRADHSCRRGPEGPSISQSEPLGKNSSGSVSLNIS